MFRRQVQIDLVKTPRKNEPVNTEDEVEFSERALMLGAILNNTIRGVTTLVVAYMAADASRKIIINRLSK